MRRFILTAFAAGLLLFIVIQLIPVPRTNPTVTREVHWDSTQTRDLAKRACFDCHSNESVWPWYANIAPVSFLISDHVKEGREKLNFSQWDQPNEDFQEVQEVLDDGEMPPWDYLTMHPEARFTSGEKQQLMSGLRETFQIDPPIERKKNR